MQNVPNENVITCTKTDIHSNKRLGIYAFSSRAKVNIHLPSQHKYIPWKCWRWSTSIRWWLNREHQTRWYIHTRACTYMYVCMNVCMYVCHVHMYMYCTWHVLHVCTVYPQTENLICYYGDQLARSRPGALHSVALANRHLGVEPYVRAKTVVMGLPRVEIESFLLPTTCGCWCQVHADALIRRCK